MLLLLQLTLYNSLFTSYTYHRSNLNIVIVPVTTEAHDRQVKQHQGSSPYMSLCRESHHSEGYHKSSAGYCYFRVDDKHSLKLLWRRPCFDDGVSLGTKVAQAMHAIKT